MCRRCCQNYYKMTAGKCNSYVLRREPDLSAFPRNYMYGYAYTPVQSIKETYNPCNGLANGTIFPELVSPYSPDDSIEFINYLKNQGGVCNNGPLKWGCSCRRKSRRSRN